MKQTASFLITTNFVLLLVCLLALSVSAQSGGTYEITQSVVANGGAKSEGGQYSITGTAAQSVAGRQSSADIYSVRGGFWQSVLDPTAAAVSVSGRVLTANGGGIRNVRMTLAGPNGTTRTAITSSFGYYRFDGIEVGQTYVVSVRSKRFQFSNPTLVIALMDELTDLTFTALPE